jgi:hypothetical protein
MTDDTKKVREITEADKRVIEYMQKLEAGSLDTLEAAARQIITLVTSLIGLFLGILAFKDDPAYLDHFEIKLLGALALGAFFIALLFALNVIMPREYKPQDLTTMRDALAAMLRRKRDSLRWANISFGAAILMVLLLTLFILL